MKFNGESACLDNLWCSNIKEKLGCDIGRFDVFRHSTLELSNRRPNVLRIAFSTTKQINDGGTRTVVQSIFMIEKWSYFKVIDEA